jgi:uncharacterized protein YjbI with pentapeptide repeats
VSERPITAAKLLERYARGRRSFVRATLAFAELSGADLTGVDFGEADLTMANLAGAHLSNASLTNADLSGANLRGVSFREADLMWVKLSHANLSNANLSQANLLNAGLSGADLSGADLSAAWLNGAVLHQANLSGANLSGSHLQGADLREVNLSGANLGGADLHQADLSGAKLPGANLSEAGLTKANLNWASLKEASLNRADLLEANLSGADLSGSDLSGATLGLTLLLGVDLSHVRGLDVVTCQGPSYIDRQTLALTGGNVPRSLLEGCGFRDWEIISAQLYGHALTHDQFNEIQYKAQVARMGDPIQIGSLFISYSHSDTEFVDALGPLLQAKGVRFWRDVHHSVAGRLEKQVDKAIRLHDQVLLVLSAASVQSDWVEHEVRRARAKEKDEKRDVLCPIALDDAWKTAPWPARLMEQVKEYNILDFSKWRTRGRLDDAFARLLAGLAIFYAKGGEKQ